jgi:S1-C subfamily serine protease
MLNTQLLAQGESALTKLQLNNALQSTYYILVQTGLEDEMGSIFETGTGFLVADGYIITNAHVVYNLTTQGKIYIANEFSNDLIEAKLVSMDTLCDKSDPGITDLALLKFDKDLQKNDQAPVTLNLRFQKLQSVMAIGYPHVLVSINFSHQEVLQGQLKKIQEHSVVTTPGIINAIAEGESTGILVHSAQISKGNSGGPLLNENGEVIGINTWNRGMSSYRASSNMAQPAITIAIFLKHNNINPTFVSDQTISSSADKSDKNISYDHNPCLLSGKSLKLLPFDEKKRVSHTLSP